MLYSMLAGITTLAVLSLIFSLIGARSSNRRWIIGTVVCSLAAGILGAVLSMKYAVSVTAYFNTAAFSKGLKNTVDFAAITLLLALMLFALSRVAAGFIRPLKTDQKPNNPLWRAAVCGACALFGAACSVFCLIKACSRVISHTSGSAIGDAVFIGMGILYLVAGIVGVMQWNGRRKRLLRDKQKQEAKAAEGA